jgi:hypothetical protein
MAQITIYLDDDTLKAVNSAVKEAGVSKSEWIAEAVRQRMQHEWPASVLALFGAWPDFPAAEEIRKRPGKDAARETL